MQWALINGCTLREWRIPLHPTQCDTADWKIFHRNSKFLWKTELTIAQMFCLWVYIYFTPCIAATLVSVHTFHWKSTLCLLQLKSQFTPQTSSGSRQWQRPDQAMGSDGLHYIWSCIYWHSHQRCRYPTPPPPSCRGSNAPVEHWSNGTTTTKRKANCLFSLADGHSSTSVGM